jgi:hypothetical protein
VWRLTRQESSEWNDCHHVDRVSFRMEINFPGEAERTWTGRVCANDAQLRRNLPKSSMARMRARSESESVRTEQIEFGKPPPKSCTFQVPTPRFIEMRLLIEHRRRYGYRRSSAELRRRGVRVNRKRGRGID